MANPYKEAEKNKKKPPVKPQDAQNEEKVTVPQVEEEKATPAAQTAEPAPRKKLKAEGNSRKGKGRSLYLSDEVMAALTKEYKKQGYNSVSAYLEAIAKDYFGLE